MITRPALAPFAPWSDTDAEFARIVDELTRRGFLAGGLGTAALGLTACGSDSRPSSGGSNSAGLWTYTDDLGRKISLPRKPTRIASLGDGLTASLWSVGVRSVAAYMSLPADQSMLAAGGVPLHGHVAPVSAAGGEVNLEALARAKPDLIITATYGDQLSNVNQAEIFKIAPVAGVNTSKAIDAAMGSITRLAQALGIDPADKAAEGRYQAAAARLRAALADKPGLRITWAQDNGSSLVVLYPRWSPFTLTLTALGADFYPAAGGSADIPGQSVSWELVPAMPTDLVLVNGAANGAPANPAWKLMPAVKAGQYLIFDFQWYTQTYANYATLLEQVAATVEKAKPGIGPR